VGLALGLRTCGVSLLLAVCLCILLGLALGGLLGLHPHRKALKGAGGQQGKTEEKNKEKHELREVKLGGGVTGLEPS
jgi:hypothetical protein